MFGGWAPPRPAGGAQTLDLRGVEEEGRERVMELEKGTEREGRERKGKGYYKGREWKEEGKEI